MRRKTTLGRPCWRRLGVRRSWLTTMLVLLAGVAGDLRASDHLSSVPTLDDLSGDWMEASTVRNPPSVNNFWGGLGTTSNLTAFELLTLPPYSQGALSFAPYSQHIVPPYSQGGDSGVLSVDGKPLLAEQSRWFPYQVLRRTVRDGVVMESALRMPFEQQGLFCQLTLTNTNSTPQTLNFSLLLHGRVRFYKPDAWNVWSCPRSRDDNFAPVSTPDRQELTIRDEASPAVIAFAFTRVPDQLRVEGGSATADWHIDLPPHASVTLDYAAAVASDPSAASELAKRWAKSFDQEFEQAKTLWEERWQAVFVPGNKYFSGHLPTLVTADAPMRRVYYESALVPLLVLRTNLPASPRCFVTGGPQWANTLMYFWDAGLWAHVWAMLDPATMKDFMTKWLTLNLHSCYALDCMSGKGAGPWYAANDWSVFRSVEAYVDVTGDTDFLKQTVAGKTVLEHLETLATACFKRATPDSPLADYGGAPNLLECAPAYINRVPSLNAANVYMLRRTADYLDTAGDKVRAGELRAAAEKIRAAVLELYVPGEGVWMAVHRDGQKVQLRHCYDYIVIGQAMTDDLPSRMKSEMTAFVERELLTKTWMRAMSLQDPAAALSDRPDHGPLGSYDGWPPLTMDVMCRFGAFDKALAFLRSTEAVTHEGPFAQSHEFLGPDSRGFDPLVRIAHRGLEEYNECCGAAFSEVIIGSFFGYSPRLRGDFDLLSPQTPRGFAGELRHVPYHHALYTIISDKDGVHSQPEGQ